GSGKTHSIVGDMQSEEGHGVLPRFVKGLFRIAQQRVEEDAEVTIKITMSMIELYMEKVRDLLVPRVRGQEPESLEIHEDQNRKVFIRNASVHSVLSYERVMELLSLGNGNRQTAETKMNEMSSRSHSVVQFTVSQIFDSLERRDIESVVSLVDLAGSERQGKTETTGQQFEEAKKINQSLLMLGRALNSFSDSRGESFVSLRDSKLTRLLSESFGGNSKTWMLATVSPAQFNAGETTSTLEYAQNALCITNKAEVNRLQKSLENAELKKLACILEGRIDNLDRNLKALEQEELELKSEEEALLTAIAAAARGSENLTAIGIRTASIRESCSALKDEIQRLQSSSVAKVGRFVGRCGVSLASVMRGEKMPMTLPITLDANTVGRLHIQLFPLENDGFVKAHSLKFCLNVVGASQLPLAQEYVCQYCFQFDEDENWYKTQSASGTEPLWNFLKQFDLVDLSPEIENCFQVEHVFLFEVFAYD
ncbi:kinesin, putative, partial [Bodo saltans]